MKCIKIKQLKIDACIGVHTWEQQIKQPLYLDLTLYYDFHNTEDNLKNVIDYSELCKSVGDFIENHPFNLIETVAENVLKLIKNKYPVKKAKVTVSKPFAIKNAANTSVSISESF